MRIQFPFFFFLATIVKLELKNAEVVNSNAPDIIQPSPIPYRDI